MATDYDAPRKTDEEVSEDSIEELKNQRNDKNSGKVDEDEVENLALGDTLGEEDSALEGVENHETLQPLVRQLPERERKILALRFVHNLTQTQIAEQVGISQMHVSRLLARTLAKLRSGLADET